MTQRWWAMCAMAVGLVTAGAPRAEAYEVGPGRALAELERTADLIVKATVIGDREVTDPAFPVIAGYAPHATTLRVVSMIKGTAVSQVEFRHYAVATGDGGMSGYTPPHWELPIGKSYIVLAMRAADGSAHPMEMYAAEDPSPGVIAAASDRAVRGTSTHDIVWTELTAALALTAPADVTVAIDTLDRHSGGHQGSLHDFDRATVLAAIRPLIGAADPTVADAAIAVFGEDSPFYDDRLSMFWLAGVGAGTISGIGAMTPPAHPTAETATHELLAVAMGTGSPALRAHAIRAMGPPNPRKDPGWFNDPAPEVRAAAVRIGLGTWPRAAADPAPEVRGALAITIGFAQATAQIGMLDTLIRDSDRKVREYAAISLLSFAPAVAAPVLTKNLHSQYRSLFINALARANPQPHLAELDEVIIKRLSPTDWSGGMIPGYDSWQILFDYLKAMPAAELATHARELDALERAEWASSGEPVELYALYRTHGMRQRAAAFRAAYTRTRPDEDQFFRNADQP